MLIEITSLVHSATVDAQTGSNFVGSNIKSVSGLLHKIKASFKIVRSHTSRTVKQEAEIQF